MTVDNEILCNIFHSNVGIERATDANGADALKEYATLWKAMVIRFGSHDDVKMLCGTISGTELCPIPLVCVYCLTAVLVRSWTHPESDLLPSVLGL